MVIVMVMVMVGSSCAYTLFSLLSPPPLAAVVYILCFAWIGWYEQDRSSLYLLLFCFPSSRSCLSSVCGVRLSVLALEINEDEKPSYLSSPL